MEGLNIWGICTFVMPLVLIIIIWIVLMIASILDGLDRIIKKFKKLLRSKLSMTREEFIQGLKDIKEYLSEKVSWYGADSEWSKDVKVIQMAIALAEGTTKDVEIREGLKRLEKRVKSLQICITLLSVNVTIALITIILLKV